MTAARTSRSDIELKKDGLNASKLLEIIKDEQVIVSRLDLHCSLMLFELQNAISSNDVLLSPSLEV